MKHACLAFSLSVLSLVGCAAGAEEDSSDSDVAPIFIEPGADLTMLPAQGGCSMSQIREAQSLCGGSINYCAGNACPRGGDICSDSSFMYQCH